MREVKNTSTQKTTMIVIRDSTIKGLETIPSTLRSNRNEYAYFGVDKLIFALYEIYMLRLRDNNHSMKV